MAMQFRFQTLRPILVGEPKSRIVQKHPFFAPERYTAGIQYMLDMKPLYSNATRVAFREKMHFFVRHIGHVKQSFIV